MKFLLIGFAVLLLGCKSQIQQLERPSKVPDNAFWSGGADGGTWFLIEQIDSTNKSVFIKVYNDQTGEVIVSKLFKLQCSEKIDWQNLKSEISSFDGEQILLKKTGQNSKYCSFE